MSIPTSVSLSWVSPSSSLRRARGPATNVITSACSAGVINERLHTIVAYTITQFSVTHFLKHLKRKTERQRVHLRYAVCVCVCELVVLCVLTSVGTCPSTLAIAHRNPWFRSTFILRLVPTSSLLLLSSANFSKLSLAHCSASASSRTPLVDGTRTHTCSRAIYCSRHNRERNFLKIDQLGFVKQKRQRRRVALRVENERVITL